MIDALKAVLPAAGAKKLSAYLVIRNRTVTAFNGEQVLSAPISCELEFAPKAKAFFRAVKKAKGQTIALWLNADGHIMVHAGDMTETVDCAPLTDFPADIQPGRWFDVPKPRKPPTPKATPPDPVWLAPGYLPGLEAAKAFRPDLYTVDELVAACNAREPLICDCEVFPNYFLVAFVGVVTGKVILFEKIYSPDFNDDETSNTLDHEPSFERLRWVLEHFLIVTFNGINFDLPILALALADKSCAEMKDACDKIIQQEVKAWQVLKSAKVKKLANVNHIDLIEVCPLDGSLKLYGGRLHAPKIQDLPFPPERELSPDQIAIVRHYCVNDLTNTAFCFVNLREQITLRQSMSERYGMDLRSKSDAQIAEAVITGELKRINFAEPERPHVAPGTKFKYRKPAFIRFETPMMNRTLETILGWEFTVSETGYAELPVDPATGDPVELKIQIADAVYNIGLGGLHSSETTVCHKADDDTCLVDRDVASYYPSIILNLELYPLHLGPSFLQVYRSIVQRRLEAKKAKNKVEAETLKIVINGSFGKFGSKWSTLYAPDLLMTVTITGQLSLLMLIERLELQGIQVCSANTDGIVVRFPAERRERVNKIFEGWEAETGFKTEETEYSAIYSRDVNNYIAVKPDGKTKTKGAFFSPWSDPAQAYERFKKNPMNIVAIEAAIGFLTHGDPVGEAIRAERDMRKFVSIRTVKGGGVKDGVYLGKVVRWYYAKGETGCIVYAKSGNKVAGSDGARPCMELPAEVPEDLDYDYYEREARKILEDIGAVKAEPTPLN
jgi:hypothetical protein